VGPEGGGNQQAYDEELDERALFVDGVHHLDVEHGWFVEAACGVVEQDEGVFEEPGVDEEAERDSDEPGFEGDGKEEGEEDYHGCCSATRGSQGVMEQVHYLGVNGILRDRESRDWPNLLFVMTYSPSGFCRPKPAL
jgi:hypothetical protein